MLVSSIVIDGKYIDKRCLFTSNMRQYEHLRPHLYWQRVKDEERTIVNCMDYRYYIKKYNLFKKSHKIMFVHLSPCFKYVFDLCVFLYRIVRQLCNYVLFVVFGQIRYNKLAIDVLMMVFINIMIDNIALIDASIL